MPASRFFAGATFPKADGVTGYNDITPRVGAAYDLFGNGKTSLKVNLGKYLQGASVSNLAYGSNPALRIPGGDTTFGGTFGPNKPAPGRNFPPCVKKKLPWQGKIQVVRNGNVTKQFIK